MIGHNFWGFTRCSVVGPLLNNANLREPRERKKKKKKKKKKAKVVNRKLGASQNIICSTVEDEILSELSGSYYDRSKSDIARCTVCRP